jgi:hypothetical protein
MKNDKHQAQLHTSSTNDQTKKRIKLTTTIMK